MNPAFFDRVKGKHMDVLSKITNIITPVIEDKGYALVRVLFQGDSVNKTLQIMLERQDGKDMKIDDCETLSRTISAQIDVANLIDERYVLEVTSPGIDRPLVKAQDYNRFKGREFKLETISAIEGRKRFKGKLLGLDESSENIKMIFEGRDIQIPLPLVSKAKLVLTDELIASFLKKA